MDETKNRPGENVKKYVVSVDQPTGRIEGVKDPSGAFHSLAENEEFIEVKNAAGEREPFIRITIPFEEWAANNADADTS